MTTRKANKKKPILLTLALCILCGTGLYLVFNKQPNKQAAKLSTNSAEQTRDIDFDKKEEKQINPTASASSSDTAKPFQRASKRSLASIPDSSPKAKVHNSKHPGKRWKKLLSSRLTRQLAAFDVEPVIKSLGKRNLQKGQNQISAEHVMISIDKGKGQVSSYEALVDPSTGSILHTWNQTQFEHAKPLLLTVKPLRQ